MMKWFVMKALNEELESLFAPQHMQSEKIKIKSAFKITFLQCIKLFGMYETIKNSDNL